MANQVLRLRRTPRIAACNGPVARAVAGGVSPPAPPPGGSIGSPRVSMLIAAGQLPGPNGPGPPTGPPGPGGGGGGGPPAAPVGTPGTTLASAFGTHASGAPTRAATSAQSSGSCMAVVTAASDGF